MNSRNRQAFTVNIPRTSKSSSDIVDLLNAINHVDLNDLVDVLSPPNPGSGRRISHALAKVRVWLISRHPASGLPTRDAPLADTLTDGNLGEAFGFPAGQSPHRTRLREAFNRLEQHPDLLDEATKALTQVLREKPWKPADGVVFKRRRRGLGRDANEYRRQRQMARFSLKTFLEQFDTPEKVQNWFVQQRWPDGIRCPRCEGDDIVERKNAKPQPWR